MNSISSITHEENSKRKSHRVNIPIQVILNNYTFKVTNWSMNGFQIDFENVTQNDITIDELYDVKLILPTGKSSIILDMKIKVRSLNLPFCGVEIIEITDKNRRVLRHYATLAIEGNIDHVDDLSGDLFMNSVATPIKEPIIMSDKESKIVHSSFLKKLALNLMIGLFFLFIVGGVLLYNYVIIRDTSGLISGNSSIYFAPYNGIIKKIYVTKDELVHKNQLLFEMQDRDYKEQLKILKETRALQIKQLESYKKDLKTYKYYSRKKLHEMRSIKASDEKYIKKNRIAQENTYHRAKYLYRNQLLSFAEFSEIESNYLAYMDEYNTIVNNKKSTNKNILLLEQSYNKNQDHIISIRNSIVYLSKEIEANKLEISHLKNFIKNSIVVATSKGKVHHINRKEGESLNYADNVLIVETDTKPFILMKVLSNEISQITINAPCIVKSERTGKLYKAHITGIGYPAIDGINVSGNELSQNEVPVKIEFNNNSVRFHLNEYVNIYIVNRSNISKKIINFVTGISLND